MRTKTLSTITALFAGSVLAGAAMAHPGGGGGFGGGAPGNFGGSSPGGAFGRGAGDIGGPNANANANASSHGSSTFGRSSLNNDGRDAHPASADAGRSVSADASTKVLSNDKLDGALTKALTRKGIALPTGGLQAACSGFGSLGQCVAALHVSQNLAIPGGFDALKTAATAPHSSLGEAIMKLRPSADALGETRKANRQADDDLRGAG